MKPKTYHHGDLRAALVQAACDILEEAGLAGLSLRAVARRAGVSQTAPYHHFADKNALLAAVAARGFEDLAAAMQARMARADTPRDRLKASGVGYVLFAVANPALFQLMFLDAKTLFAADPVLQSAGQRAYGVLEEAVAAAKPEEADAGILQTAAWATVHGLAKLLLETALDPKSVGAADAEALAENVLERMTWS